MNQPFRKPGAENNPAALEELARVARQHDVSIEDLTRLLREKPEVVCGLIAEIRREVALLMATL